MNTTHAIPRGTPEETQTLILLTMLTLASWFSNRIESKANIYISYWVTANYIVFFPLSILSIPLMAIATTQRPDTAECVTARSW